jgi:hypothetical protein
MAEYVCLPQWAYYPETNTSELLGYDIQWRKDDPNCPFHMNQGVPVPWKLMETDFDEPISAVQWTAAKGLHLKPIDERCYPIEQLEYYPRLVAYLTAVNPVLCELLKAITHSHPIRPNKHYYHSIKNALEAAELEAFQASTANQSVPKLL